MKIFRWIMTSLLIASQYLTHSFLTIYLTSMKAGVATLQLEDDAAIYAFAQWFEGSTIYFLTSIIFSTLLFLIWKSPIISFFKGEN